MHILPCRSSSPFYLVRSQLSAELNVYATVERAESSQALQKVHMHYEQKQLYTKWFVKFFNFLSPSLTKACVCTKARHATERLRYIRSMKREVEPALLSCLRKRSQISRSGSRRYYDVLMADGANPTLVEVLSAILTFEVVGIYTDPGLADRADHLAVQ